MMRWIWQAGDQPKTYGYSFRVFGVVYDSDMKGDMRAQD